MARTTHGRPTDTQPTDIDPTLADLTYEGARDELVAIVTRLESGQAGLEESMTLWQRGEALAARCTQWLDAAEATLKGDDSPSAQS
ncbi:MAG: exodeoxyribonuclease VII small subunit [Dermatophilaceae bacterium]